jgi:hypothetical protein
MNFENPALEREIAHYLKTGHHDPYYSVWPEGGMLVCAQKMDAVLRKALIEAVQNMAQNIPQSVLVGSPDLAALTRAKILPMVNGLFPESERPLVTSVLEKSVVSLTPENIEHVRRVWKNALASLPLTLKSIN